MKRDEQDNFDQLLSSRLKKAIGEDGRADWLDVSVRAGTSKVLWHWSRRRVLLLGAVLVLAVGAAGASTVIIPWLKAEPAQTPPPVYPICAANDVTGTLYLHKVPSSRPGLSGEITLLNKGEANCALQGDPKVSLLDDGVNVANLQVGLFPEVKSVFTPDPRKYSYLAPQTLIGRVTEPLEQKSWIYLWWENWCGQNSGKLDLRLEIPNGTTLELPVSKVPSCVDSAKPSLLKLDQAQGAHLPPAPGLPLSAKIVVDGAGEPIQITVGEVLHYQVGLTNTGVSPYRFGDRCPIYSEAASSGNDDLPTHFPFASGAFELNCRSVEAIEPGETVTFDMELAIPKDTWQRGQGMLAWVLEPGTNTGTKNPPTAKATIAVTGESSDYSPADVYSAFAPGTQEATFPAKIEKNIGFASSQWGPVVPGSKRILIGESEGLGAAVYAWETESGRVCYLASYAGSCDRGEAQAGPIVWVAGNGEGKVPSWVGGLVRDGVKTIDVIVDGEPVPAKFENNAFYAEIAPGHKATAIVATMDDGSQRTVAIGPLG
jgi:hypothetical protein